MKRLIAGAVILLLPFCLQAQDEPVKTKAFYGVNNESNLGFITGVCLKMPFGLRSFPYMRVGLDTGSYSNGIQTDKSAGIEVGFVLKETPKYSIMLLAGTGFDWTAPSTEIKNWSTYLTQSAGLLGTLTLPPSTPLLNIVLPAPFGVFLYGKAKPQVFDKGTLWKDRVTFGAGLYGSL